MTLAELIPELKRLPRSEQLHLLQLLAAEIARDETPQPEVPTEPVAIWSQYESFQGAADLLAFLEASPPSQ